MNKLTSVVLKPMESSNYIKPLSLHYVQDGKPKVWDFIRVHDSVAVIIYNITRNVLVLVKQFRPPVYLDGIPMNERNQDIDVNKYPAELGITIELCAGIVDKEVPLNQVAAEEVLEECGYEVSPSKLHKVNSYCADVGSMGSTQTLFYCEVTDDMKVSAGGGIHDEIIDVIEMTVPEMQKYINSDYILSPPSFLYGISWFLNTKDKAIK